MNALPHPLRRTARALRLGLLTAILLACPLLVVADEGETEGDASALPLERILLFSSGVGYFEHQSEVEGDTHVELLFRAEDINDLLKSMVVQDLGGGRISTVTYGSRDPIAKALQSFAIDLTNNLTMADLLGQVRGEAVHVETPMPLTGTIVSVEQRQQRVKDEIQTTSYLNLLTKDGLRSISFDVIRSVRLLDERLDAELRKALEILSLGRDSQKKTVTLEFLGEGVRPVRVGYIRETPVWKTSYRLVLSEKGVPFLQGWAIVENTTEKDWEGVDLTLVSGRPISYVMNLYQPLYAERPVLQPPVRAGVAPQTYEREMDKLAEELQRAEKKGAPARRSRRSGGRRPGAPAEGAAPAPSGDAFDIARGVEAAATAAEVGELFQYRIAEPVHLRRQRSAMLPILNTEIEGKKLSIYDVRVHPKHPLNAVQLVNSTDVHLMQGPVTVFDGGAYAGDALLGDLPPGEKRLLSYAMDLEVEVARESRSRPDELLSVKVVKGTLHTKHMRRREHAYVARNADRKTRSLLIAQPFDAGWTLVEPKKVHEKTRNQYRFLVELEPAKTSSLRVVEEQTTRQEIGIANLSSPRISYYLKSRVVSSAVKQALQQAIRYKHEIDVLGQAIREVDLRLKTISKEQTRIRENMGQIDRNSELYARYLKKFSDQEDEIEALRKRMQDIRAEITTKQKSLNDWLLQLDLD